MIHYILLWVLTTGSAGIATGSATYNNLAACTVAAGELRNNVMTQLHYVHISTVCTKEEQP